MANIEIQNVCKSYGKLEVIHGVTLHVENGEFVTLVGPSGCGKSTLLRMIAGLETITSGKVEADGRILNGLAPKDRDVAMVFQNYALYPHMTVAQNMGFSLRLRNAPKEDFDEAVGRAADVLGLGDLLERYPAQLSGGQRQRVAMGRAIVRDPAVFLFDEPLSNLDAKLRARMRIEIKTLHDRLGTTTIYVTHDQIEAMTMADKIVVMRAGVIEQTGSPLELYDYPVNQFVAGFLGSPPMNFLSGEITGEHADTFRVTPEISISIPAMPHLLGRAILGFRPEHVVMAESGTSVKVVAVEPTGANTQITATLAMQEVSLVVHDRLHVRPGSEVNITIPQDRLYFFDAASGDARSIGRSGTRDKALA